MLHVTDVLRSVAEGDWFTSGDLTDAYFYVPIAMHYRSFLCFSFKNKTYQFKFLPFYLSLDRLVFTRCMKGALSQLWAQGIQILPYLDDLLVLLR